MKFIKQLKTKRADEVITRKQETFKSLYTDAVKSKIPEGGVAEADNVLLFGSNFRVRPGYQRVQGTLVPGGPYESAIVPLETSWTQAQMSKSGYIITRTGGATFSIADVGKLMIFTPFDSNTLAQPDLIVEYLTANTVRVNTNKAASVTPGDLFILRSSTHATYWHQKSKKVFMHIADSVYWTDFTFSFWSLVANINTFSDIPSTKSTFDSYEDFVYLFTDAGVFKIDASLENAPFMFKINSVVPPNTMVVRDSFPDYPKTTEESLNNKTGRRYLFSMSRLGNSSDGSITERGGAGVVIEKETGTNSFPATDNYRDYREAWGMIVPTGYSEPATFGIYRDYLLPGPIATISSWASSTANSGMTITVADLRAEILLRQTAVDSGTTSGTTVNKLVDGTQNFVTTVSIGWIALNTVTNKATRVTAIDSNSTVSLYEDIIVSGQTYKIYAPYTREVSFNLYQAKSYEEIAARIQTGFKQAFPDYPYVLCRWDTVAVAPSFIFLSGEAKVWVTAIGNSISGAPIINVGPSSVGYFDGMTSFYIVGNCCISNDPISSGNGALNIPVISGLPQFGWTHYSVYSTKLIGEDFETGGALGLTNPELFIWNQDVPIMACFYLKKGLTTRDYTTTGGQGRFSQYDVGSRIYVSGEAVNYITEVVDANNIKVTNAHAGGAGFLTATIGVSSTPLAKTTLAGQITVGTTPAVGTTIFWSDGTTSIVTSTGLSDLNSRTGMYSILGSDIDYNNGREFNDPTSDDLLDSRSTFFPLAQRFWENLPDGRLGNISAGFFSIAQVDDTKFYYTQFNFATVHLAGHYYSEFQFAIVKGKIRALKDLPNQLIIYCRGSTWRAQTNVINTVTEERVGEAIAILSGVSVVDGVIGAVDQNGIADFGTGKQIVITAEPGIRIFDGYNFSPNMIMDNEGQGYIKDRLQLMRGQFNCIYDPVLYGFVFWGNTDTNAFVDHTDPIQPDLVITTECYRLALEPQQGFGFSKLSGNYWLRPDLGAKPLMIEDLNGNEILIVFDGTYSTANLMSTRQYTQLDNLILDPDVYFSYTDEGRSIAWICRLREDTASEENHNLRFLENYFFSRPENDNAYRAGQAITMKAYIDGNTDDTSFVSTTEPKSIMSFPHVVEARRIQMEISGTESEFIGTGVKTMYDVLNKRQAPTIVNEEDTFQSNLSTGKLWLTRSTQKMYNRFTNLPANTIGTFVDATGPDSYTDSAVRISSPFVYTGLSASISRNYMFCVKITSVTQNIFLETNTGSPLAFYRVEVFGANLRFYHGATLVATIPVVVGTWYAVRFGVDDTNFATKWTIQISSASGVVTATSYTFSGPALAAFSGSVQVGIASTLYDLYDFRFYDFKISQRLFDYYAFDVLSKGGFSLLPVNGTV